MLQEYSTVSWHSIFYHVENLRKKGIITMLLFSVFCITLSLSRSLYLSLCPPLSLSLSCAPAHGVRRCYADYSCLYYEDLWPGVYRCLDRTSCYSLRLMYAKKHCRSAALLPWQTDKPTEHLGNNRAWGLITSDKSLMLFFGLSINGCSSIKNVIQLQ